MTRVVMRPPGQSGKAKRGHLCFDASFETGKSGCFEDQILRFILSMCVCSPYVISATNTRLLPNSLQCCCGLPSQF